MITRPLTYAFLSLFAVLAATPASYADTIRVCSKYTANKCVVGKTRTTKKGDMVRLPGGTWIYCSGDCSDRLRIATVDFWKNLKLNNN